MDKIRILWADDEIDSLKPQILFLEQKGYEVATVTNGYDALEILQDEIFDLIFLDESMPGITGIETISYIKKINDNIPVVMISKNEEENIMEEAIGSQIADYLIKPVNPNQVLLTVKKLTDAKRLVREKTTSSYQHEFQHLFAQLNSGLNVEGWKEFYKSLVFWDIKIEKSNSIEMKEVYQMQKREAQNEFYKFVEKNYLSWIKDTQKTPLMSHNILLKKVFPQLMQAEKPTILILIDNLRFDQWKIIEPLITEYFRVLEEDSFFSILPTTTQYSRNAIFAGLMPLDIQKKYPQYWKNDIDEGGKNLYEKELLIENVKRNIHKPLKVEYVKVLNNNDGKQLVDNIVNYLTNDLTCVVYNFVDLLSHARTEMDVIKELASNENAYRNIVQLWFSNSPLWAAIKKLANKKCQIIITTDHGSTFVTEPAKLLGDRETTSNLRYKHGRNMQYSDKDCFSAKKPEEFMLTQPNVSSTYVFAKPEKYFCYPNNFNYFANMYRNSFQHGGISLEEMIIPVIRLSPKNEA